jgi:D-3-phosphoglycerate dehydrogenase
MIVRNTLVLDAMPDLFWQIVEDKGMSAYFTKENLVFSEDIEILILRTKSVITESHYKRFPNLKCIIRAGSGYDNIDVKKADDYGITVQNTPLANVQSAFEHTIGFLFSLIKNHKQHNLSVLDNKWREGIVSNLEISDLRVLVVGIGRVGSLVAKFLTSCGAEVKFVDPYVEVKAWIELGIEPISYEEGLAWANLVTYHCPLYKQTKHYFDKHSLNYLKNIYLLNVSRGGVVDVDAVVEGIEKKKILGAGIDVMESEPWQCEGWENIPQLIMTPHTGAYTEKAKNRLSRDCFEVWSDFNFRNIAKHPIKVW